MGGGASAVRDMEEIVACTFLIGKAIAAVSFPGKCMVVRWPWRIDIPYAGILGEAGSGLSEGLHGVGRYV